MDQFDAWMSIREPAVNDKNYGDSIAEVEELLRRHEDFEKTIDAQQDKHNSLKKTIKVRKLSFFLIGSYIYPILLGPVSWGCGIH